MARKKIIYNFDDEAPIHSANGSAANAVAYATPETIFEENITIKKAKVKDDLFLEVEYSESEKDSKSDVKKSCTAPVHDDLKESFSALDEHLSILCDQYTRSGLQAEATCKGFSIGGSGDHEGVTLIGTRNIETGALNLVSPFIKWDNSSYKKISELGEAVEHCKNEVLLYLRGKHKPDAQQELPFAEEEN